jgi:SRSO17 transposase
MIQARELEPSIMRKIKQYRRVATGYEKLQQATWRHSARLDRAMAAHS